MSGLDSLLRRIDASGSSKRKVGSGRQPLQAVVQNNGALVEQLRSYNFRCH